MELYLIRHPPPDVAPGVCYGRSDVPVAAAQVAAAAARLRTLLPTGAPVYASPLARCRTLAQELAIAPRYDERLMEMHFGEWELRPWDDIERGLLEAWAADPLGFAPPGGESARALRVRALSALDDILACGAPAAAIVAHAGPLRFLAGHLRALGDREAIALRIGYGEVLRIRA